MRFKVNGMEYTIQIVEKLEEGELGNTDYLNNTITLAKCKKNRMLQTLAHELMHIWLFEYGHNQNERNFSNEDVCEIIASSIFDIYRILELFKEEVERWK